MFSEKYIYIYISKFNLIINTKHYFTFVHNRYQQQKLLSNENASMINISRINGFKGNDAMEDSDDDTNAYSSVNEDENSRSHNNRPPTSLGVKQRLSLDQHASLAASATAVKGRPPSSATRVDRMFGDSVQHSEESDVGSVGQVVVGSSRNSNNINDGNNNHVLNSRALVSSVAGRQSLMMRFLMPRRQ